MGHAAIHGHLHGSNITEHSDGVRPVDLWMGISPPGGTDGSAITEDMGPCE